MTRAVLRAFGRLQRKVAWSMLAGGVVSFFAVFLNIIYTGDAKFAALLGSVMIINDGFQACQEVENERDSEGSANQ